MSELVVYNGAYGGPQVDAAIARAKAGGEIDQIIASLRAAVGTPLVAATAADMTNINKIYVYTGSEAGYTAGDWYYWNGAAWTDGGVYNAVAVDSALSPTSTNPIANKAVYDGLEDLIHTIVDEFSTSVSYIAGKYVRYNGDIYRFTQSHANGAWTGADATLVIMANDLMIAFRGITVLRDNLVTAFSTSVSYSKGDYVIRNQFSDLYRFTADHPAGEWTGTDATIVTLLPDLVTRLGGIDAAVALKAPIASPTFTGTPKAPTPTAGDDSTKIATTAFVKAADDAREATSYLLVEEIPNTVQTYTFVDGTLTQILHKNGGTTVRTDVFTYAASSITETRTLNTGEVLTIVTDLTTLETTVTYTAA